MSILLLYSGQRRQPFRNDGRRNKSSKQCKNAKPIPKNCRRKRKVYSDGDAVSTAHPPDIHVATYYVALSMVERTLFKMIADYMDKLWSYLDDVGRDYFWSDGVPGSRLDPGLSSLSRTSRPRFFSDDWR